jgi:drug/metabolite transporter (DMT)-like permease
MLIKYALVDFSPVEVTFFQLRDILRRPFPALVLGALGIAAPFILISTGELSIPSGFASASQYFSSLVLVTGRWSISERVVWVRELSSSE